MKLILGLGNPGKRYEKTRHNVGFIIADALRDEWKKFSATDWHLSKKFNAEIAECAIGDKKIVLAKPMTFMNDSGQAAQLIAAYYKLSPADILVIHDDKDLPLGQIKIQTDRGHAGHKGVESVMAHLGAKEFTRARIGIANPDPKKMGDTAKFVLDKFSIGEKRLLKKTVEEAVGQIAETLHIT
ncbi:MAG: aminoacyl-tRNA hydrolase [Candidatus Magasanikbacteria bacterium RIFCSPHIGHO2_02_FULL_51_14]|uniref:Peptidyl-tRNA hydrolase n=1 Tax=Candidatus Magasanikbacteria bacterium RIFCSPHIGHO2_02_FULL_51_14 TaxID=1798683 RepID=A0A1F6MQ17_9BACT|nr:MAG: aminoacyl-tRNA hydrolase [Candidatus Magasanikbacteria bacterium RIFCSPHIGHO2_02_FULL_51_14]